MGRIKKHWHSCRRSILTAIIAVLLYELLEHLPAAAGAAKAVFKIAAPITLGLCLAYVVSLPVRFLEERVLKKLADKRSGAARAVSMAAAYALIIGVCALCAGLVIPRLIESVAMLADSFEGYYQAVSDRVAEMRDGLALPEWAERGAEEVSAALIKKLKAFAVDALPRMIFVTKDAVGAVLRLLAAVVISIYALAKKEKLLAQARRFLTALLPRSAAETLSHYAAFADRTFRKYIAGQLTSCLIIGALCYMGMRIMSMPYPELISVFIAVAALIPIIGPWASTLPSALIILVARQDEPLLALWFLLMIVIIQQLDDNIVYPRVVGDAVGVSGIWVLGAVVIFGGLFGIGGLLVAVPTTAVLYRIAGDITKARLLKRANGAESN